MGRAVTLVAVLLAALGAIAVSTYYYVGPGARPDVPLVTAPHPAHLQPPEFAPDFSFTDLNGQTHRLSDWTAGRSKYVLLNFWAPWCGPCRKEIPMLIQLQKRYGGQRLQIIGPAVDKRKAVADYVADAGINYPVFYGPDRVIGLTGTYGDTVGALPYSVLIAPDGRILESHAGRLSEAMAERWAGETQAKQ